MDKKHSCSNCKFFMDYVVAELSFGYGSLLDGEDYEFCSDECLKEFVNLNVKLNKSKTTQTNGNKTSEDGE